MHLQTIFDQILSISTCFYKKIVFRAFLIAAVRISDFWVLVPISVDLRSIAVHLRQVASASDLSHRMKFVRSVAYGSDRSHRNPSVRSIAEGWCRSQGGSGHRIGRMMGFHPEIGRMILRSVAGGVLTLRSVSEPWDR